VVTYAVTISLTSPPASVRVGMSAQASVTTAQAADVLTIPSVALRGISGNYSALVLDDSGVPQTVPVTVGLVSNGLAEIQSGLAQGERVVTGTVSARQGTTPTTGGGLALPGGAGGLGGGAFGGAGGAGGRGTGGGRNGTGGGATQP
jgi:macrolide-specific efflux system membrane fusion protein